MNNKHKGSSGVIEFLPVIIMLIIAVYTLINISFYMKYIDILNRLENISRKYLLIMETEGGLTEENALKLNQEINELGVIKDSISFEGTTFWDLDINYGDDIFLYIKASIPVKSLTINDDLTNIIHENTRNVKVKKCGISLA